MLSLEPNIAEIVRQKFRANGPVLETVLCLGGRAYGS
jgi:hypothetical protein